MRDSAFKIRNF